MRKIHLILLLILELLVCTPVNSSNTTTDQNGLKSSSISEKVYINGNWSSAIAMGICTGDGSSSNPYLIQDLTIDGDNIGNCIAIENSEYYLVIENCTVYNSGPGFYDSGIKLINVSNAQILNNYPKLL